MAEACDTTDSNTTMTYAFRFGTSDKLVHLTQQQLDLIPYLSTLVAHKDDFSSIQNENGEYVLNHPIEYTSFMSILCAITSEQPYTLINEISEDDNILDTLQLLDYLNIKSFPLPLLRYENLVQSNPINTENKNQRVEYHKANVSEARQTAAEFIIALAKNEYKLSDSYTKRCIFTLINIILFNTAVFNSRFRYHTLTVVKKRCYSFFSKTQRNQVQTTHRVAQYRKTNSSVYLSDDDRLPPNKFQNTFTWRGVYVPIEDNHTHLVSASLKSTFNRRDVNTRIEDYRIQPFLASFENIWPSIREDMPVLNNNTNFVLVNLENIEFSFLPCENWYTYDIDVEDFVYNSIRPLIRSHDDDDDDRQIFINQIKQDYKLDEAQSARSGHFNTFSKRPNVDKFKHRFGPKVQKYR